MKKIAVAIVNYNTCEHLRACLATIDREAVTEVIVVDNSSTDGSVAMVQAEYPWVALSANTTNPGYGAAANQAIALCQAQYVLLLNSDTRLRPGTLQVLINYFDQQPKAAIVGPHLVNPDGSLQPSCSPFPTPLHVFLQESTLGRFIGALPILRDRYLRTWSHSHRRIVPWVLGAALAIRRRSFVEVNGFDESFFMYAEEIDLCYRLRAASWEIHYTPDATIIHIGGASTRLNRADMSVQFFISMLRFYRRHFSDLRLNQFSLIMKTIVLARLVRDSVRLRQTLDMEQRYQITENVDAWRRILLYQTSDGD